MNEYPVPYVGLHINEIHNMPSFKLLLSLDLNMPLKDQSTTTPPSGIDAHICRTYDLNHLWKTLRF